MENSHIPVKGALVVGGTLQTTEVIDFANSSINLDFKELPSSYQMVGVGGVLGDKPIICGGNDNYGVTNYCLHFENDTDADEKWTSINALTSITYNVNYVRSDIASIQLQPNRMWIIGGLGCKHFYTAIMYDGYIPLAFGLLLRLSFFHIFFLTCLLSLVSFFFCVLF